MIKKNRKKPNNINPIRPTLKWVVLGVAAIISGGSIVYTNYLVQKLREREKRQIEIYAKSLEFIGKESSGAEFIYQEIIASNNTIPVILTSEKGMPEFYKNISEADKIKDDSLRELFLLKTVEEMQHQYPAITVTLSDDAGNIYGKKYIYYKNSLILSQLQYYPYIQLSIIAIFGIISFLTLNYLKRTEQNQVWMGMARETAHQLGTPLSSLMAWSEYFKEIYPDNQSEMLEFDKDIERLKTITDRFSSIGSEPQLVKQNLIDAIENVVNYLRPRLPSTIEITTSYLPSQVIYSPLNLSLFAWVIENLCKNAADAMEGRGHICINTLIVKDEKVAIDVSDSGKGIPRQQLKNVFRAGYTTKKRGWGLGLALTKRIIEEYHKGKIFIKNSEINRGTTFRIYLDQ